MAKVYLDSGDTFALSGAASVYGSTGTEKVIVNTGVTGVVVDANVERVDLPGASSAFTFKQAGNQLQVLSGSTVVATIPLQDDANGTQVVFSNGSVDAKLVAGTPLTITLGGVTVPSAAAAAVTPTTIDATVTSGSGSSTGTGAGQTFSLTTAVETKALTSGNDTVDGSTVANSLSGDTLVDASTTDSDVLNAIITATPTKPVISNVETMNIDFKGFNLSLDASSITGGTIVASTTQEFNTGATITGLSNKGVGVNVGSGITTLTIGGSTEATDAANVKLAGGNLTLTTNNTNAIETVGLNSTGSAANVVTLTSAATAETFNVTGDKSLTLKVAQANITGDTVTKALTGGSTLTVELTTAAAALDLKKVAADTFTTAATGNTAIAANIVTFAAGTTNLEVNDATVLTNVGSVLTADGTATTDVLNLKLNKVGATNILASSGFETVNITNGTTGDVTLANAAHTFGTSGAAKLLGSGNFSFGTTAIVAKSVDASAMTGTGKLTVSVADNTAAAVAVTGTANNDTITVAQTAKTATIDAGNGSNTVSAATATFGVTITTGTGNDTITSGTGNDTITAGAGNDTITATAGAGNHVILGGEGDDSIDISAGTGNIFVNAGTGNDLVSVGANLTLNDTIVGGDGTDTLAITNAGAAATNLDNVSGFETLTLTMSATGAYTTKDTLVASGSKLTVTQTGGSALTWNGAAETDGTFDITANGAANHTIIGGAGADVINVVGAGSSSVTGGKGGDVITITGAGTTTIVQAKGDSLAVTSLTNGISLAGADVVKNGAAGIMTTGDKFDFGNTAIATTVTFSNTFTGVTLANDKAYQIQGDYNTTTKTFVASGTGADSLFVYDADSTSATQFETIVLTGYVASNAAVTVAAGVLTLA